ncbi:HIT family protein [Parvularcula sp. ZS-1/3]|uniref:HIT family protein n=1 Tax=Parvularcula mediterranea TaxID=2732508 RepID=A0A7Y3RN95_9PROT|nr:HIT family protein [Parvularcula mediterranea]NNU17178.1 HIT family protein [Parvularcula mediterranea]
MSLNLSYDDENVFAKIIRGEMPKVTVYEDDHTLAFMDVFPQSEGHVLVISKLSKSVNLCDLDEDEMCFTLRAAQKVARAVVKALAPDGFRLVQYNGEAAGQTVFHTHFHIIPVWEGRSLGRHGEGMASPEELEAVAERIRHAL